MKHRDLIALMILPVVALLLLAQALPHHHHGGEMCIAMEYCDQDHAMNDSHTQHHDDGSVCMGKTAVASSSQSSTDSPSEQLKICLLIAMAAALIALAQTSQGSKAESKRWPGYKSTDPYPHTQLRAPPHLL